MDRLELWIGSEKTEWGVTDDKGWCLSTDSSSDFDTSCTECILVNANGTINNDTISAPTNLFVPGIWTDDVALCSDESKIVMVSQTFGHRSQSNQHRAFLLNHTLPQCANGNDGLYIDRIEMWHDGTKRKSWGTEDDSGWCLSTDSGDNFDEACTKAYNCSMISMGATENELGVESPLILDDHQPTFPLNSTYKPWLIGSQGEQRTNIQCNDAQT